MTEGKKTILVGVSGGSDSAFVISLLYKKYNIIGIFLRMGSENKNIIDEEYARRVCEFFNVRFYPVNAIGEFKNKIIDYFLESYQNGITPNPCVECNKFIKFKFLIQKAKELECDYVATGHYAQIKKIKGELRIVKAVDKTRDQSYFLYKINKEYLDKMLFPLGKYFKKDIQEYILEKKIPCFKSESRDICFISGDHNDFLKENIKLKKGNIVDNNGKVLGTHGGLALYTVGQRRGIEINHSGPFYVIKLDYKNNKLIVSDNPVDNNLHITEFRVIDTHWFGADSVDKNNILHCSCVVRYGGESRECIVKKESKDKFLVKLSEAHRAVTPGQSVVFYSENILLGGGIIIP